MSAAGPQRLLADAFVALLASFPGLEANRHEGGLGGAGELRNDGTQQILLLVISDPDHLRCLPELRSRHPEVPVLALAPTWTPEAALQALETGLSGCLSLDASPEELATALRQVGRGDVVLAPHLTRALVSRLAGERPEENTPAISLSAREHEILQLVTQGLTNKEIGQRLVLSVRTVENHLASTYTKLGVRTRTEAAVLAMRRGWASTK